MRCLSVEPGLVQTSHVLTYLNRSLHKVGTQSTPFYRGPKLEQKMNHGARTEWPLAVNDDTSLGGTSMSLTP